MWMAGRYEEAPEVLASALLHAVSIIILVRLGSSKSAEEPAAGLAAQPAFWDVRFSHRREHDQDCELGYMISTRGGVTKLG